MELRYRVLRLHAILLSCIVLWAATAEAERAFVPLRSFVGQPGWHAFGASVAGLGDVDGDGVPDYAVGSPGGFDAQGFWGVPGTVAVFSGRTSRLLYQVSQGEVLDGFGTTLAGGRDLDGDGIGDFVVGAPNTGLSGTLTRGALALYSGASGALLHRWTGSLGEALGGAVAIIGDVDGDGVPDIAASVTQGVRVFSSRSGAILYQVNSPGGPSEFGASIADIGDVTGDGVSDFAVGTSYPTCTTNERVVSIVSGATGQIVSAMRFLGGCGDFGSGLAGISDLDGDGRRDLAIGSPSIFSPAVSYVYSTATDSLLRTISRPIPSIQVRGLGFSIASAGNSDGDGDDDVYLGAPLTFGDAFDQGGLCLYSPASDSLAELVLGPTQYAELGYAITGVGDINGDGRPDVLAGAPGIYLGAQSATDGGVAVFGFADIASSRVVTPPGAGPISLASPAPLDLYVEGVAGSFTPGDVMVETVRLRSATNLFRSLASVPVPLAAPPDLDGDGVPEYVARFSKQGLRGHLSFSTLPDDTETVFVEGDLRDGRRFQALTLLVVEDLPARVVRVLPNPIVGGGYLSFRTSTAGRASLRIFNVKGELVQTRLDGQVLAPGIQDVPVDNAHLASGVYYYRLVTVDGTFHGRFVLLR